MRPEKTGPVEPAGRKGVSSKKEGRCTAQQYVRLGEMNHHTPLT
jgi:hypothetical protein